MPPDIHKTVVDRDHLSILLATRGRVESVAELLATLGRTVARPDQLDVWVYVDEDDAPTLAFLREAAAGPIRIHQVAGPPTETQGEMYNRLLAACSSGAGLYLAIHDKTRFLTEGWDAVVRARFDRVPDRLLFAFPQDSVNGTSMGTVFVLSAEWINRLGRLFTAYFPYWFDDSWLNDVAKLIGRWEPLPVAVDLKVGPTQRMHNLIFWNGFYDCTLVERLADAEALRAAMGPAGADPSWGRCTIADLEAIATMTPTREAEVARHELQSAARMRSPEPRPKADSPYRRTEERAVAHLRALRAAAEREGRADRVARIDMTLACASAVADGLIAEARQALSAGSPRAALPAIKRLMKRFELFPESHALWVEYLLSAGLGAEALDAAVAAHRIFPREPGVAKCRAAALHAAGHRTEAVEALKQVLDLNPSDVDALMSLGNIALSEGDPADARERFAAAIALAPEVEAYLGLADAAHALGDIDAANTALAAARALEPHHPALMGAPAP